MGVVRHAGGKERVAAADDTRAFAKVGFFVLFELDCAVSKA